ncbi:carbohydrate ABC transporter permease [Oceanispirochaeta sp.]|jgi:ABC-type glycerol-3-phosphate transport system permease component|uniref:carbohydrate ABC transporter permease n=1 Tax=Oceanispirochaeta sp. TaxID=2035350 RepID=UPI00262C720A|nr:carbohydrate ABC transporter permease [Oceanispirochaeta sp.]MDA3956375.1 carbohydrate ABC transporter permease [Oceanispirochaeta sp.]
MNKKITQQVTRSAKTTTLYIIVTGVAMALLFPMFFLFTFSLMSDYESYSEWPKPLIPSTKVEFRLLPVEDNPGEKGYALQIYNHSEDSFMPFGPVATTREDRSVRKLYNFIRNYSNSSLKEETMLMYMDKIDREGMVQFTLKKGLFSNYSRFFSLYSGALPSVMASLTTALLTIAISLSIGGMAGYAFARYIFKGKNLLKLSVLFVRMFPPVAIALPMVIILGKMGLYDKPAGLSLIYSINQISLSIWITASIFMGIPESLEEAAQIFGTTRVGAFFRITLPLAVPGLAACAMYSFIYSWNEVINALILTQFNPTLPVIVYRSLLGANAQVHLIAAGSVAQALPAIVFTLFIRKYILQMWGGVKV